MNSIATNCSGQKCNFCVIEGFAIAMSKFNEKLRAKLCEVRYYANFPMCRNVDTFTLLFTVLTFEATGHFNIFLGFPFPFPLPFPFSFSFSFQGDFSRFPADLCDRGNIII